MCRLQQTAMALERFLAREHQQPFLKLHCIATASFVDHTRGNQSSNYAAEM